MIYVLAAALTVLILALAVSRSAWHHRPSPTASSSDVVVKIDSAVGELEGTLDELRELVSELKRERTADSGSRGPD